MSERTDRRRAERRDRILDVAERIIVTDGFDGMTMESVAEAADVAVGTPYLHFKNKNALCVAVLARLLRQVGTAEMEQAARCETGSEKLLACRNAISDFIIKYPEKWKAMRELRQHIDYSDVGDKDTAELVELFNQYVLSVARFYREAIKEGTVRPDVDPEVAALFLYQALIISVDIPPHIKVSLKMNGITPERWLEGTDNLLTMATHAKRPNAITGPKPLAGRSHKPIKN
jgi:AcrR family transcriptional regulator